MLQEGLDGVWNTIIVYKTQSTLPGASPFGISAFKLLDIKLSVLLVMQAQCKCDTGRNTPRTEDKDENI